MLSAWLMNTHCLHAFMAYDGIPATVPLHRTAAHEKPSTAKKPIEDLTRRAIPLSRPRRSSSTSSAKLTMKATSDQIERAFLSSSPTTVFHLHPTCKKRVGQEFIFSLPLRKLFLYIYSIRLLNPKAKKQKMLTLNRQLGRHVSSW